MTATALNVEDVWSTPDCDSWLGLGARLAGFVHEAAERTDLVVRVSPEDIHPRKPAACFLPALAEVRFAAAKILTPDEDDPDRIDPMNPIDRALYPELMGAATHESAHAAHTRHAFPVSADPSHVDWAEKLEEPRIEHQIMQRMPKARTWLQASLQHIVMDGDGIDETAAGAVLAMVLVVGRSIGGVLDDHEVTPIRDAATDILGAETVEKVETILADAVVLEDGDTEGLLQRGGELADLVKAAAEDRGETPPEPQDAPEGPQGESAAQGGEPGDESAGQSPAHKLPCGSWTPGELPADAGDAADPDAETGDGDPVGDDAAGDDAAEADRDTGDGTLAQTVAGVVDAVSEGAVKRSITAATPSMPTNPGRAEQEARDQQTRADARIVFGPGDGASAPIRVESHQPDPQTRTETRALIAALRRAQYRGTTKTRLRQTAPPGRIDVSQLVQQQAQAALGMRMRARPWTATRRREVEQPELVFGISSDVSDSMQDYQGGVARMTYAIEQSVRYLGGTVAGVAWNTEVAATTHPGDTTNAVRVAQCGGGSHGCPRSLTALDGALQLTSNPSRVRVVAVVTDGCLPNYGQINDELKILQRSGVHVLWVTPAADAWVDRGVTNLVLAPPTHGMGDFGAAIGKAVARLLEAA